MTYKRKMEAPERVRRFAMFSTLIDDIEEFGLGPAHFLDWLELKLQQYVAEFAPVGFDEHKRSFGDDIDMARKVPKVDLTQDTTALITEWREKSAQLAQLRADEGALRLRLVESLFTSTKLEGAESIEIGWGWRMKATKSLNISATNASKQTEELLNGLWAIDQGLTQGLVSWKPDISTKGYRAVMEAIEKLPDAQKNQLKTLLAAAITVKPGMPELEMIPPKEEIAIDTAVALPGNV